MGGLSERGPAFTLFMLGCMRSVRLGCIRGHGATDDSLVGDYEEKRVLRIRRVLAALTASALVVELMMCRGNERARLVNLPQQLL